MFIPTMSHVTILNQGLPRSPFFELFSHPHYWD